MDSSNAAGRDSRAIAEKHESHAEHQVLLAEFLDHSRKHKPENAGAVIEPNQKKQLNSQVKEKVIEIADVDKTIGWWQKKEYSNLGVQRIRLGQDSVALELKDNAKKNAIVISLELAKNVSFNFEKNNGNWTMKNVQGLKVEGNAVSKVESSQNKITFSTSDGKKLEYGKGVNNYTKALFDPLMSDDLRK